MRCMAKDDEGDAVVAATVGVGRGVSWWLF